jgi:hypothetical protein
MSLQPGATAKYIATKIWKASGLSTTSSKRTRVWQNLWRFYNSLQLAVPSRHKNMDMVGEESYHPYSIPHHAPKSSPDTIFSSQPYGRYSAN